ncbi:DNA-binding transcriptional regulator, LysR family [Micromonospora purpureochromogenes]|uniref:DNA-binding transcriptional regulator, LysR family n=1 Tax=Micromonospora purpureochromogenes TaxID=47872 RepID=A0A1C4VBI6_9ACTN|nr:LysR family transcriptional regulator [Micromonospora purpureochromogenes]SCE81129.1 DNA-binding transcriptional regulator, LysR family [Micromonospora purpureochromogenes]
MKVPLDLLRSFLAVHRSGSITAAAELLGLAQPTVTAQLRALEEAVGRPLFDRVPRGVLPTPAGDELARRVADPLDRLDAVLADDPATPYPRTVFLGGPAEFLAELALPAVAGLVAEGLELRVSAGLPEQLLDDVAAGRLDLVVSSVRPRRRGLAAEPLYDEEFALVAAPAWGERLPDPVTPQALRDVSLVAYAEEAPILRRWWRTVFDTRLTRTPNLVVADLRAVLAAVVAGAGASVLPTYLCRGELASGALRPLSSPAVPPLNTLFLAARPAVAGRREVQAVRRALLTAAAGW